MSSDYKSTIFLPKTAFPMKGRLPEREPEWLRFWDEMDLEGQRHQARDGAIPFVLHDGPPYANGHLHIGHALNKILKDMINRGQFMLGHAVDYRPGWDCHGLPIEWKIEEQCRTDGQNKDDIPVLEFRRRCREFAASWVDIQREEFKRLGISGQWDHAYTTMTHDAEATILRELGYFLVNGGLIRGDRPVLWSVAEKTALAEAEVEYHDHVSTTITVRFPVVTASQPALEGAHVIIWTTTPWTIPGNRAVAYGEDIDYGIYHVEACQEGSLADPGEKIVCAEMLWEQVSAGAGVTQATPLTRLKGKDLHGTLCHHPLYGRGYDFSVPLLPGDHVTVETGSGFVHIAPGHGAEDFAVGMRFGLEVPRLVDAAGLFLENVPLFAGDHVFKANGKVADALQEAGQLLSRSTLTHSYPHSWRSQAPLIFRTTPQWFISMEANGLRDKALSAIDQVNWFPESGRNRIRTMVESRPDWCVSRQRVWGVPIAIFIHRQTGEPLRDPKVMERVVAEVEKQGSDAWFSGDHGRFLVPDYDPDDYEPVSDILDVWFDSGATHAFVLKSRGEDNLKNQDADNRAITPAQGVYAQPPADLYVEGSDQHRGWFQSSLLESCGTRGSAPYKAVLTHGFVLDDRGRKMSKSLGNVVAPQDVARDLGVDILRLWVATSDYGEDLRIGPEVLKAHTDTYRRLRNMLRFLLGNLESSPAIDPGYAQLPELERWVLHRLWALDAQLRSDYSTYRLHRFFNAVRVFCITDLSAFYFDIRKDSLYCDAPDSPRRRGALWVLEHLFSCLTSWLAPALCFTAEEAWQTRRTEVDAEIKAHMEKSVHLRHFPEIPQEWCDSALAEKWSKLRSLRRVVTGAVERERAEKRLGSSLQACPILHIEPSLAGLFEGLDWAEITITSAVELRVDSPPQEAFSMPDVPGMAVVVGPATGEKCTRCWKILPEVVSPALSANSDLCYRCREAVVTATESAL